MKSKMRANSGLSRSCRRNAKKTARLPSLNPGGIRATETAGIYHPYVARAACRRFNLRRVVPLAVYGWEARAPLAVAASVIGSTGNAMPELLGCQRPPADWLGVAVRSACS